MVRHRRSEWVVLGLGCALALACGGEERELTGSVGGDEPAGATGAGAGGLEAVAGASGRAAGTAGTAEPAASGAPARPSGGSSAAGGNGPAGGAGGSAPAASSQAAAGSTGTSAALGGTGGSALGGAGAPAAGSGSASATGDACVADPLASKKPFGSGFYQKLTGLFGCTVPADLALYRKMLPEKFAMPTEPQVCFYVIDFEISSVGRYHEAAILLPATYKGEKGSYVLTMDLDNAAAISGGRALGFPKYRGEVTLEQNGHDWTGTARAMGAVDLRASYTGACTQSDAFLWPDFFNLTPLPSGTTSTEAFLPPRSGSVLRVPAEYLEPPTYYSLNGSVTLEINDTLPWNGLVDETKPFPGLLSHFVGGINLGRQALD